MANELRRRRNSKAAYVRQGKTVTTLMDLKRPASEVNTAMQEVVKSYNETIKCHENLMLLTESDDEFDDAEKWIDECRQDVLQMRIKAADCTRTQATDTLNNINSTTEKPAISVNNDKSEIQENPAKTRQNKTDDKCAFKLERPKLPKFDGDVRGYITFKSDFQHAVESTYSPRDSIALLRTCLTGKPLDIITGVGNDYAAAWEYLDVIYGDPRFIADIVTQDIASFEPLLEHEDSRFCELVLLIRRSYNSLKEVNRPYDMDNNHMIALVEQKMSMTDRKEWARELERSQKPAKLAWMTCEMRSRIRATAAIRASHQNSQLQDGRNVNYVGTEPEITGNTHSYRCWVCQSNGHWVDQCIHYNQKSVEIRVKMAKDNKVCHSCLKKASKGHNIDTCRRRRQCTEECNGVQCPYYHHPLLHTFTDARRSNIPVGVTGHTQNRNVLLPTLSCHILGNRGNCKQVTVLFDSGAQVSLIRESVARELNLPGQSRMVSLTKVGGHEEKMRANMYQFNIKSLDGNTRNTVNAIGRDCINDDVIPFSTHYISAI